MSDETLQNDCCLLFINTWYQSKNQRVEFRYLSNVCMHYYNTRTIKLDNYLGNPAWRNGY